HICNIIGGVNIDELGVDQQKGNSTLHLFMPPTANDSCIGYLLEHLCQQLLTAMRWKAVADRPEIINDAIVADPNIDIITPTLIQYPSRHYHASSDKIETLSPSVMQTMGNLCATHMYFLANAGPDHTAYLARITAAVFHKKLAETELRLIEGNWPFCIKRTRKWYSENLAKVVESFKKFGFTDSEVSALHQELSNMLRDCLNRFERKFPTETPISASSADIKHASQMILKHTTLGMVIPPEIQLPAKQSIKFFDTLYKNNLDLIFFRICYWANGKRTLLEIVELLEFEMDLLMRDTSIARTVTGALIDANAPSQINLNALLHITDVIIDCGYLKLVNIRKGD
ncbi:hypothetical protein KA005_33315, partial [bacterium]|nr:hypothetical protein [bacterium]